MRCDVIALLGDYAYDRSACALGIALVIMVDVFMALLSFRGFGTPSLTAQGEQRRSF